MKDADKIKQEVEAADLKWEIEHGYISVTDYFGGKPRPIEHEANAFNLLRHVNALLAEFAAVGGVLCKDPDTGTHISGSREGTGDGGYRLSNSATGRPGSAHKEGMAVDVYDVGEMLDEWITRDILIKHQLYREAKQWTPGWAHLQTREPGSRARSFNP